MGDRIRAGWQDAGCALAQALFLIFLEVLKAQRASQWSGAASADLLGLAVAGGIYWGVLWAGARALSAPWRGVGGARGGAAAALAGLAAGCALWGVLSTHREFFPTAEDALVIAGFAGLAAARFAAAPALTGGLCCAFAAACAGSLALGDRLLFAPDRARWVTTGSALWLAAMLAAFAGAALLPRRARRAGFAAALCLAVGLPWGDVLLRSARARHAQADAPNVVLVIADTLRAKDLRLHGGDVPAPALERLAAAGAHFDRAYSLSPWTLPSMTGLFAGQYPPGLSPGLDPGRWQAQLWQYRVPEHVPPLQYRLADAGYATAAITGNALLWVTPGMTDGFDTLASAHPILLTPGGIFRMAPFLQAVLAEWLPALAPLRPHDTTAALARYADAYLRRHRADPFHLWLHYIDPHAPYDPPRRYRGLQGRWPFFHPYTGGERWGIPVLGDPDWDVPEADRDYVASLYRGEIQYVDEFLGQLLDTLARLGLDQNTYVVFTSDHGEELWEHGDWGHGQSLHEEQIHVPLIIAGPGIVPRRVATPVSAVDLAPTLAELLGLPADPAWHGQSLAHALRAGRDPEPRPVFAQGTSNRTPVDPLRMILDWPHKLVEGATTGTLWLHDLERDPGERHNRAADDPDRAAALRARLHQWLAGFDSTFPGDSAAPARPELLEQLHGMGYF